jgi:hypothetical protein
VQNSEMILNESYSPLTVVRKNSEEEFLALIINTIVEASINEANEKRNSLSAVQQRRTEQWQY